MVDTARGAANYVTRQTYALIQKLIVRRLMSLWVTSFKYQVTTDPRMPMLIRTAIHDIADTFWINLVEEVTVPHATSGAHHGSAPSGPTHYVCVPCATPHGRSAPSTR